MEFHKIYSKYGVIPKEQVALFPELSEIHYHGSNCCLTNGDDYICCINILGNWFFKSSKIPSELFEYNPNVDIVCKKWCRGTYVETEYKINIISDREKLYKLFDCISINGFAQGSSIITKSFEEYHYIRLAKCNEIITKYYVVIHENHSSGPNAIKYKINSSGEILTRIVTIVDYSEENLERTNNYLINGADEILEGPSPLPVFVKKKKRMPVVDKTYGYIYGVSYSISSLQEPHTETFCQVEIEYWSRLAKKSQKNICTNQDDLHHSYAKLINALKNELVRLDVKYDEKQITKIEWLTSYDEK